MTTCDDLTLLGLTGRAGSGKDTAAAYLCKRYGFVSAAFAEAPRAMLEALLDHAGVDYAWLHEPGMKERDMPVLQASYRTLMQTLGTDWGRGCIGGSLWVRILDAHIGVGAGRPVHDRIVITDLRFHNEDKWLHDNRGRLVRLRREQATPVRPHESEPHTDNLRADWAIDNHGFSTAGLHGQLDGLMRELGLEEREPLFREG